MRLELPGGQWAEIADPRTVSQRKRKPVLRMSADLYAAGIGQEDHATSGADLDLLGDMNEVLIAALVTGWSFDAPVTLDAVQDLPGAAFDALAAECAKHMVALIPNFEPNPDPASPTEPSGA